MVKILNKQPKQTNIFLTIKPWDCIFKENYSVGIDEL